MHSVSVSEVIELLEIGTVIFAVIVSINCRINDIKPICANAITSAYSI